MLAFGAGGIDQVADGALVVLQGPEEVARGILVGQDLVDGGAVQVAVGKGARGQPVEFEGYFVAVVEVVGVDVRSGAIPVGVERTADEPIEGVVGVVDGLRGSGVAVGCPVGDLGEAIATVTLSIVGPVRFSCLDVPLGVMIPDGRAW